MEILGISLDGHRNPVLNIEISLCKYIPYYNYKIQLISYFSEKYKNIRNLLYNVVKDVGGI